MKRISIDVTADQHQKLKALAALQGKSIKQYVLESTLGAEDDEGLAQLEAMLDRRLREEREGAAVTRTVGDVFREANRQLPRDGLDG